MEGPTACEATVVHEIHVGSAVQKHSIKTTLPGTEPEFVRFWRSNETDGSDRLCDFMDLAILIRKLLANGTGRYVKKIVKFLHCNYFDIDIIGKKLKRVALCSELVLESYSHILDNKGFLKKKGRIGERGSSCDSILYREKVVDVPKR